MAAVRLPEGCFPTMITPWTDDLTVDWPTLDKMIEWYIASGCTGLFAVCQSSEMFFMSNDERIELARHVYTKAAGRVKVVATGTFDGTVEEQAAFVNLMAKEVDAVVVLISCMAKKEDDNSVWTANVQKLLDLTGDVPLGLYECPAPYHRLMDAATIKWCADSGRFLFHKDTCCDPKGITDKLAALSASDAPNFSFYNANAATVQYSVVKGGQGFSGICANFYPQLVSWLCRNPMHEKAKDLQDYLAVAENVIMYKYPTGPKIFLSMFEGFTMSEKCRNDKENPRTFTAEERLKLESLHATCARWCKELGIERLNPATGKPTDAVPNSLA